jgi:hypothetical protein
MLTTGTYVQVTEPAIAGNPPRSYIGRVVGYDMGRTKYHIGARFPAWGEWRFANGGSWAFPSWVTEISKAEALQTNSEGNRD